MFRVFNKKLKQSSKNQNDLAKKRFNVPFEVEYTVTAVAAAAGAISNFPYTNDVHSKWNIKTDDDRD